MTERNTIKIDREREKKIIEKEEQIEKEREHGKATFSHNLTYSRQPLKLLPKMSKSFPVDAQRMFPK